MIAETEAVVKYYMNKYGIHRFVYPPTALVTKMALDLNTAFLEAVVSAPRVMFTLGIGKSVYGLKTLYYVYDKNWNIAKQYIVFMPQEFLRIFERAVDENARIPIIVWDDAGHWVGRQRWQNKFVVAVREFLNVIRTHIAVILFTAPRFGELAKGIRDNLNMTGLVRLVVYDKDPRKRRSRYQSYLQPGDELFSRRRLPTPVFEWTYSNYFKYYMEYEEKRKQYVEIGLKRTKEALKEIAEQAAVELEEIAKKYEPSRKPEPAKELDLDEIAESIDMEDLKEVWGY